ncbi:LamG domain-containing protein [Candidatus Pacearchaeota archaeon]|nr:LamG domain-containing protein [Candidatus Pacearchaeota archaeon]
MARNFNGSTDRIDWSNIWNPSGLDSTISMWMYWDGSGGQQWVFNIGDAGGFGGYLLGLSEFSSGDLMLWRDTSGTTARQLTVGSTLSSGVWVHVLMTGDSDLSTTNAHIYTNGVEASYSGSSQSGTGTEDSHTGTWTLGGRVPSDTVNFGGYLCELALWNTILSADNINALAKGYSPLFFLSGMQAYIPLIRNYRDRITATNGTLDGTTVIEHPLIIYPSALLMPQPIAAVGVLSPYYYYDLLSV